LKHRRSEELHTANTTLRFIFSTYNKEETFIMAWGWGKKEGEVEVEASIP
jgi:hypothetical protein